MQKIKKIVASVLLVTIIFLMIPFDSFASPLSSPNNPSVSGNGQITGSDAEAAEEFLVDSYNSFAEPIFDICKNAGYALTEFDEGAEKAAAYIYYYLMPSGVVEDYAPPALVNALEDIKNKWIDGTKEEKGEFIKENFIVSNNKVILVNNDIKDAINWLGEQTVQKAETSMILYQTVSVTNANKFLLHPNASTSSFNNLLSNFDDNDYPLVFQRWNGDMSLLSLSNIGDDKLNCDGLIFNYGSWDGFVKYFKTFQLSGYLNDVSDASPCSFYVYADGRRFTSTHIDFKEFHNGNTSNFSDPLSVEVNKYLNYYDQYIRMQTCIFSLDGSPLIFFKDSASYLDFYSNKSIIPYDFNGSNIDYTDFFNNLDKSALDSAESLADIYAILNDTVAQGLQDAVDRLTTNNEWLKKIYKDLHDWKKEWNIRNIFSTLTDIIGAVDDLLSINRELMRLVNNQIDSEVIDDIEGIIHNTSLLAHIKSKFPFCIPIALVGTVDYISSFEPMPLKFSISSNALGVPLCFDFDYESIPGHTTVTVIVKSFIFLIFAFGMFKLTLNIMGKIGGGS